MIFELLLILPIYIGVFVIFYRFKHVIKAMSEIEMFSEIIESSEINKREFLMDKVKSCLLYTSPSPRDLSTSRMPSSA